MRKHLLRQYFIYVNVRFRRKKNLDEVGLEISAEAAVSVPAAHGVPRALQTRVVPANKYRFLIVTHHYGIAQRKLKNGKKIRKNVFG